MVAVTTYTSKGGSVSTTEADANFTNLNTGKVEDALSFPSIRPSLMLDFVNGQTLDPRITFTRASTATFVGSNGLIQTAAANVPRFDFDPVTLACRGLLIEEQRTNLFTYSEDFSDAIWNSTAAGLTVLANAGTAPNGTNTAQKLVEDGFLNHHRRGFSIAASAGSLRRFSVFAKAAERTLARGWSWSGSDTSQQSFDLANGTCAGSLNPTITSVGNGWYRCAFDVPSSHATSVVFGPRDASATNTQDYTGTLGWGILVWGAQLEAGSFATSYIPTAGSQVTRSADSASMTGTNFSSWFTQQAGTFLSDVIVPNTTGTFSHWGAQLAVGYLDLITNNFRFGSSGQQIDLTTALSSTSCRAASAYTLGATHALSVNGAAAVSTSNVQTTSPSSGLFLGTGSGGGLNTSYTLNGTLRKIAFYPRRLTNAQLQALTTI